MGINGVNEDCNPTVAMASGEGLVGALSLWLLEWGGRGLWWQGLLSVLHEPEAARLLGTESAMGGESGQGGHCCGRPHPPAGSWVIERPLDLGWKCG